MRPQRAPTIGEWLTILTMLGGIATGLFAGGRWTERIETQIKSVGSAIVGLAERVTFIESELEEHRNKEK